LPAAVAKPGGPQPPAARRAAAEPATAGEPATAAQPAAAWRAAARRVAARRAAAAPQPAAAQPAAAQPAAAATQYRLSYAAVLLCSAHTPGIRTALLPRRARSVLCCAGMHGGTCLLACATQNAFRQVHMGGKPRTTGGLACPRKPSTPALRSAPRGLVGVAGRRPFGHLVESAGRGQQGVAVAACKGCSCAWCAAGGCGTLVSQATGDQAVNYRRTAAGSVATVSSLRTTGLVLLLARDAFRQRTLDRGGVAQRACATARTSGSRAAPNQISRWVCT